MLLTGIGLSFDNFINEFGHSLFGEVDEFGLYIDSGGEQTFELLAESTSDASVTLTTDKLINILATSTSDFSVTITLDQLYTNLLAESLSDFTLVISLNRLISLLAESLSDAITEVTVQDVGYTSLLAESVSIFSVESYFNSSFNLLAESLSYALLIDLKNETLQLIATSTSSAIISDLEILPHTHLLFTNLGLVGTSDALTTLSLSDVILSEPITEEGLSVVDDLTEFGILVLNPLSSHALTTLSKYVFYDEYSGIVARISSESQARTKLRYQYFQYPYIIIFDSNYNLISVEDINTGKFIQVKDNNKFTLDVNI